MQYDDVVAALLGDSAEEEAEREAAALRRDLKDARWPEEEEPQC